MNKLGTGGPEGRENHEKDWSSPIHLADLDPGAADPGYWERFRSGIMSMAVAELARRQAARVTVGDVLESWARTLVPLAAAAAMAALVMIWRGPSNDAPLTMEIEEALTWDLENEVLPTLLGSEGPGEASAFIFASETF